MKTDRSPVKWALGAVALAAVALLGATLLLRGDDPKPPTSGKATEEAHPSDILESPTDETPARGGEEEPEAAGSVISKKELIRLILKLRRMGKGGIDEDAAEEYNAIDARLRARGTEIQHLLVEIAREAKERELCVGAVMWAIQVGNREIALALSEFLLPHDVLGEKGLGLRMFIVRKLGEWRAPESLPNIRTLFFDSESPYHLQEDIAAILPGFGADVAEEMLVKALRDPSFSRAYEEIGNALARVGTRSAADALVVKWESLWGENGRNLGIEETNMIGAVGKFPPDLATRVFREFLDRQDDPSKRNLFSAAVLSNMEEGRRNVLAEELLMGGAAGRSLREQTLYVLRNAKGPEPMRIMLRYAASLENSEEIAASVRIIIRRDDWKDHAGRIIAFYDEAGSPEARILLAEALSTKEGLPQGVADRIYREAWENLEHENSKVRGRARFTALRLAGRQPGTLDDVLTLYDRYGERDWVKHGVMEALARHRAAPEARKILRDTVSSTESKETIRLAAFDSLLGSEDPSDREFLSRSVRTSSSFEMVHTYVVYQLGQGSADSKREARAAVEDNTLLSDTEKDALRQIVRSREDE